MAKPRHALRRRLAEVELDLFAARQPVAADEVERHLAPVAAQLDEEAQARARALVAVARGTGDRDAYRGRYGVCGIRPFTTRSKIKIFLIPIETFPEHVNNLYLILDGQRATLFDVGSQTASTRDELARARIVLAQVHGDPTALDRVSDVVLSHAHIDHFGGVGAWKAQARVHMHELDARVVTAFEERIIVVGLQLRSFLERAGIDPPLRAELEQMYVFTKGLFRSVPVDATLRDGSALHGYIAHHAPGHCPGQVCLQVDNVLLTADHVLPRITPHQSPESITPSTGLGTYFDSLEKFRHIPHIDLALPGHEEPITRLHQRIDEIADFHRRRLVRVREICREARSLADIAAELFGEQKGYGRLLALQEAGAHVEWLQQRGHLEIANLPDLLSSANPAIRYRDLPSSQ